MRQVPTDSSYLIVGSGRLARHLSFYFDRLELPYEFWNRGESKDTLKKKMKQFANVLLAIRDDAIVSFYEEHASDRNIFIHFSGQVNHPEILGFHPIMTFTDRLYKADVYPEIHFVGVHSPALFQVHFPNFKNPYHQIQPEQKALYHALCVLCGNGTTLLWELASLEFQKLGLNAQALLPYLKQVSEQIGQQSPGRFTGPWYRGDEKTNDAHSAALQGHKLQDLFTTLKQQAQKLDVSK